MCEQNRKMKKNCEASQLKSHSSAIRNHVHVLFHISNSRISKALANISLSLFY